MDEKVEILYHNFWRPLVEDIEGNLLKENVANELWDYRTLMLNASQVYSELADLSKTNTAPHHIINNAREKFAKEFCLDLLEFGSNFDIPETLQDVVMDFVAAFVEENSAEALTEFNNNPPSFVPEMVDISPEAEGGNE